MLTITKRPTAKNQGKSKFCLTFEELTQIQLASKDFPVRIEVYSQDNDLVKSIPRSKFKNLIVEKMSNSYHSSSYYIADYSSC